MRIAQRWGVAGLAVAALVMLNGLALAEEGAEPAGKPSEPTVSKKVEEGRKSFILFDSVRFTPSKWGKQDDEHDHAIWG